MLIIRTIGMLMILGTSSGWSIEQGKSMEKSIPYLGEELIGQENSRFELPTPALVLDLDAMEENIAAMREKARQDGMALRPHCKSHKSIKIAELQVKAGALGVSCATMGEAETMAHGGIPGLLITSPVVSPNKIDRLIALHKD